MVLAPGEARGDDDTAAVLEVAEAAGVGYALFMNIGVSIIHNIALELLGRWRGKTNLGIDQELVFAKLLNLERICFPVQLGNIAPRLPFRHLQQLPSKLSIPVNCPPPHRKTLLVRPTEWSVHLLDLFLRLGV